MMDLPGQLSRLMVAGGDLLLGWTLRWPQEAALVIVSVGTAALLAFVRLATTDQKRLRTCRQDRKRLRELLHQARRDKDKEAAKRCRVTLGMVGVESLKAEVKPLLASLVPIIVLATWAFARLAFVPPQPGQPVTVKAYFPVLSIGGIAHLVPLDGLACRQWIAPVVQDTRQPLSAANGVATWRVAADARPGPYMLEIRHQGRTVVKELLSDGQRYSRPVERYGGDGVLAAEVVVDQFRPFGLPWMDRLYLAPWVVAYLAIAIPLAAALRRAFGIL